MLIVGPRGAGKSSVRRRRGRGAEGGQCWLSDGVCVCAAAEERSAGAAGGEGGAGKPSAGPP